jgi:hypothetical protein
MLSEYTDLVSCSKRHCAYKVRYKNKGYLAQARYNNAGAGPGSLGIRMRIYSCTLILPRYA